VMSQWRALETRRHRWTVHLASNQNQHGAGQTGLALRASPVRATVALRHSQSPAGTAAARHGGRGRGYVSRRLCA
jgi:hypothetical protein